MSALKASEALGFLRNPPASCRAVLIYGPDQGLVSEHVTALAKVLQGPAPDPFSLVKLTGDVVAGDPGRLLDELSTIALFGNARVVWLRADGRQVGPACEMALSQEYPARLIVEAGDLKAGAPLRRLFEQSRQAVAIACYADAASDILRLIDEAFRPNGQVLSTEARAILAAQLGGDRLASRQELQKLALYCHGQTQINETDVLAVCGDASSLAIDSAIDAMGLGERERLSASYARLIGEGYHPSVVIGAAQRHILQIYTVRLAIDEGKESQAAIKGLTPPLFFKRLALFERQIKVWTSRQAQIAHDLLGEATLAIRQRPGIALALAERALLRVATMARRG